MEKYTPAVDAVAGSVTASALVGLIPLLVFFAALVVLKRSAHTSGLIALITAIVVAVAGFKMPVGYALLSALQGAAFGIMPIALIVIFAIWLYQLTVINGRFEDLRNIFDRVGHGDIRVQALLIAFCFGGLLEALAGFGAPVAITATMVMALGIKPLRAAAAVLVANTAPVAYGAIGTPITTAGKLTNIDPNVIGAIIGRQSPILALIVPLILLFIIDGRRGIKDLWPIALCTGVTFAVFQFLSSNFFSYELTDIVAALGGLGGTILFMKIYEPKGSIEARERLGVAEPPKAEKISGERTFFALFPYLALIVVFGIAKLVPPVTAFLASTDVKIPWPVIHEALVDETGAVRDSTVFNFSWLSSPGSLLLITGIIVAIVYRFCTSGGKFPSPLGGAAKELGNTFYRMRWAGLTIVLVLSLAYVMNFSGQTISIGVWLAGTGAAYAFISPILGWVGTAVTGSDTSANALFAKLQQTAAVELNLHPELTVAANTSGGVVGKLISPQNLAIAATAANMPGQESVIFRKVLGWSVVLVLFLCLLIGLQSTPILGWMLAGLDLAPIGG